MHDHYSAANASVASLINKALVLAGDPKIDKALEVGCCVGRGTFQLAEQTCALTLGIDVSPLFLRKALQVQKTGKATYDLRRSGLLYERQEIPFKSANSQNVDFWAADAMALPFADQSIAFISALNVIDCVPSPVAMLQEVVRTTNRFAAICSPWDWTGSVTPEENWIGGHSPRANYQGDSAQILKSLLPPSIRVVAEEKDIPWGVRMHDKHTASYKTDLIVLEA
jgi:hypothetical protein